MKYFLILIAILVLVAIIYFVVVVKPKFGGDTREVINKSSSQYSKDKQKYVNPNEELLVKYEQNIDYLKLIKKFFFYKRISQPEQPLPQLNIELRFFQHDSKGIHYAWLGHSSILVNIEGVNILVDPVFSESVSPVSIMMKRFQAPVITMENLPAIDLVLISHDHYDHLDMETIEFFAQQKNQPLFITPLGIGEHLKSWGVAPSNIEEHDWWESAKIEKFGIEVICTPAQHFSGRKKAYENQTLWSSWVIQTKNQKSIYFSGDSGYADHFKLIGNKYGPFDLAFIENGQYDENWKPVHMMPKETVQASIDLNTKLFVPIHWGMFNLALHSWFDPVESVLKDSQLSSEQFVTPRLGEVMELGSSNKTTRWWQKSIK